MDIILDEEVSKYEDLVVERTEEGYTIFKNLDTEMVESIKNMKFNTEKFNYCNYKNSKIVQVLSETQLLALDDKNKYFVIDKESYENSLVDDELNQINAEFSVSKAIKKTFGKLYNYYGQEVIIIENQSVPHKDLSSKMYTERGIKIDTYGGIEVSQSNGTWCSIMFCYLNRDGNIVNRDYNIDLLKYVGKKGKSKEDYINEVLNKIPDVSYKYYGNKWFSDSIIIEDVTAAYDAKDRNATLILKLFFAKTPYEIKKYKLPKKLVDSSRNDIIAKLLPYLDKIEGEPIDYSKYLNGTKPAVTEITKRVQTTIIDEGKYSEVFDLVDNPDFVLPEELLNALKNIENSIDIGANELIVAEFIVQYLENECELPSFSFSKGEEQPENDDYIGLVKLPYGCNFSFCVEEGDAVEISWDHSIYSTSVVGFELID